MINPFSDLCTPVRAQVMETRQTMTPDTLTLTERISVRVNALDMLAQLFNFGVEYDIFNTNWNRWAVNVNFRANYKTNHTFKQPYFYNLAEIKVEGREYWRTRRAESSGYLKRHDKIWEKLLSCRRMTIKHPKTTYYRGGYIAYDRYSFRLPFGSDPIGKQGTAISLGGTYGIVRPLYGFTNGNSIDFEIGVSGGVVFTKYEKFTYNRSSDCYPRLGNKGWHIVPFPVVNELHASVVYRLGNYPIQKKYRWRYDVDDEFRRLKDSLNIRMTNDSYMRFYKDSVYRVAHAEFTMLYDSLMDSVYIPQAQQEIENKANKYIETLDTLPDREQSPADKKMMAEEKKAKKKAAKKKKKETSEQPVVEATEENNAATEQPAVEATEENNAATEQPAEATEQKEGGEE